MLDQHRISFIVIGRNQEKTIYSCIQSIINTVELLLLKSYEIIYIDSMSEDRTVNIIKENFQKKVHIYRLYGYMNAAVGRNLGYSMATGDVLFFIDGDMEINPIFLSKVYSECNGLRYNFVSGKLKEYFFNKDWIKVRSIEDRYNISEETYSSAVGGVFLIKANLFKKISGFKNEIRINEDTDFSLRLAKQEIFLLRIPETIALHNTSDPNNLAIIIERIRKGNQLYSGLLLRKHIFNKYFYKELIDRHKVTLLLLLSVFLSINIHSTCILIYPVAILGKHIKYQMKDYWLTLTDRFLNDVLFLVGILFFFKRPIDSSRIKFEKLM